MKLFSKRALAVALALGFTATSAIAQTTTTNPTGQGAGSPSTSTWTSSTFDRLDTNRDGVLSRQEAQADPAVNNAWNRLDAQNSGRVSKEAFERYRTMPGTDVNSPNKAGTGGMNPQK